MKKLALLLVSLTVVACTHPATKDTPTEKLTDAQRHSGPTASGDTQTPKDAPAQAQSIYFEYAKSAIAPGYGSVVQNEASAIKGGVTLEGNCDERGSAEYNLGLGQRRADAVKKLLVAAGMPAAHIRATSLGKEKPKATCHDESCWKENRRVDFVQGS